MNINSYAVKPIVIASLVLAAVSFSTISNADKLYKWVDKNGKVSYQSSPPPANSKILKESTIKTTNTGNLQSDKPAVVVYTVVNCGTCLQVMDHLKKMSIPYSEQSLSDQQVQSSVLDATGQLSAPTVSIGGNFLSNISIDTLNQQLNDAGYEIEKTETKPNANRLGASSE